MSVTPVPPNWYRDALPRDRDTLLRDHLAEYINRHWAERGGYPTLVLDLINAAWDRVDALPLTVDPNRDAFMAAVLAELAARLPRTPRPHTEPPLAVTAGRCSRPGCERSDAHVGFHKDGDGDPLCNSAQTEHGEHTGRVCIRVMGHLGHHSYVMWHAMMT